MTLPPALPGERLEFSHPTAGRIAAYAARDSPGPPLLMVHSVHASGAASEFHTLFEQYRGKRQLFALDLPGYGHSERSDRSYTPRLMCDALHAMVAQIQARCGPGPVDGLALSLGCEFLARAAVEAPASFSTVALVSPTGLRGGQRGRGAPGSTRQVAGLLKALHGPGAGWGGALYRGLTQPGVMRYFLRKTWGSAAIDETMAAYAIRSAREPGAEHAPLHFLSGGLFSADIHEVYESLTMPVWMCHGVRGDFTDYRGAAFLQARPNWHFTVFQTGALPQFEVPVEFQSAYDHFLAAAGR
jgi:pimeloyl-ACP methyl ester carboxylesterase